MTICSEQIPPETLDRKNSQCIADFYMFRKLFQLHSLNFKWFNKLKRRGGTRWQVYSMISSLFELKNKIDISQLSTNVKDSFMFSFYHGYVNAVINHAIIHLYLFHNHMDITWWNEYLIHSAFCKFTYYSHQKLTLPLM